MNRFEKIFFAICLSIVLIDGSKNIIAKDLGIAVAVDEDYINFNDETGIPFAENGRTLVPLRVTMEALNVSVTWNQELYRAELKKGFDTVIIPLEKNYIIVNNKNVIIDSKAEVYEERIYLPIRAVCEAFGYSVEWNSSSHVVEINNMNADEIPEGLYDSNATVRLESGNLNIRTSKTISVNNIVRGIDNIVDGSRIYIIKKINTAFDGSWYQIACGDGEYFVTADYDFYDIDPFVTIEEETEECNYTYGEWVDGVVTYYCACTKCCGPSATGTTASGAHVQEGLTCAADWSIYPVGTWVEIEGYGIRLVQDRGGAVKGQHIDIYCDDHNYASTFGTKPTRIRVVYKDN